METPTSKGGVGQLDIPLLADVTKKISRDYGVLLDDQGVSLRSGAIHSVSIFRFSFSMLN